MCIPHSSIAFLPVHRLSFLELDSLPCYDLLALPELRTGLCTDRCVYHIETRLSTVTLDSVVGSISIKGLAMKQLRKGAGGGGGLKSDV